MSRIKRKLLCLVNGLVGSRSDSSDSSVMTVLHQLDDKRDLRLKANVER